MRIRGLEMTRRPPSSWPARVGIVVVTVQLFLVLWIAIAANPWRSGGASAAATADPRVVSLHRREARLRAETLHVRRVVNRRWAAYRRSLVRRQSAIASARRAAAVPIIRQAAPAAVTAPSVRVVTLPAQTITRTS